MISKFLQSIALADETSQLSVIANNANIPTINSPIEQTPADNEQAYYISNGQSFAMLENKGLM